MKTTLQLNIEIERGDPYMLEKMVRIFLTKDGQFELFGATGLDMEIVEREEPQANAETEREARQWDHADYDDKRAA